MPLISILYHTISYYIILWSSVHHTALLIKQLQWIMIHENDLESLSIDLLV